MGEGRGGLAGRDSGSEIPAGGKGGGKPIRLAALTLGVSPGSTTNIVRGPGKVALLSVSCFKLGQ